MKKHVLYLLDQYHKKISPLMGNNCRFFPSCSVYAAQAVEKRGLLSGFFLSLKRLLKCQPLHPGGYDPVE